jgi:hypothetical protein
LQKQRFGDRRGGCFAVARSIALGRIRHEGELRNDEALALYVLNRKVHTAFLVPKDAESEHFANQVLQVFGRVMGFHTDQSQESGANAGVDLAVDVELGMGHSL